MFLLEPPRTEYDLHFQVFGVPVRVHPLFWLGTLILGWRGETAEIAIWVGVVFVSILVHELGHAFTMRHYGEAPRVVLYLMGGLAIADRSAWDTGYRKGMGRSAREQILISAAGPGAGFLFAGFIFVCVQALFGEIRFVQDFPLFWRFIPKPEYDQNAYLSTLVYDLLWCNIFWGLVNLLPVIPLDGGQIARELLQASYPDGAMRSLWLSVFVGGAVAIAGGMYMQSTFMMMFFGSLAASCYFAIQQMQGRGGGFGGGYGGNPW